MYAKCALPPAPAPANVSPTPSRRALPRTSPPVGKNDALKIKLDHSVEADHIDAEEKMGDEIVEGDLSQPLGRHSARAKSTGNENEWKRYHKLTDIYGKLALKELIS